MSKMVYYASRAEQVKAFRRDFIRTTGLTLTRRQSQLLNDLLQDTAMVAAAGERHRTLEILKQPLNTVAISNAICRESVLKVLGYQ